MVFSLPWFLDLGTGRLVKKRLRVDVVGPGPRSTRFEVLGPGNLTLDDGQVAAAVDGDWDTVAVMMLHTLACAERAVGLLELLTGLECRWPRYPDLPIRLYSHSQPMASIEKASFLGEYRPNQAAIHFEYAHDDPWLSACLAHDLVLHEVCHAFLHGTRGWLYASPETMALTESLGDLLAMFSAGRLVEARRRALLETGGAMGASGNVLSRFAELPGFAKVMRDISTPVSRSFVEAEYAADSEDFVYGLAVVLSSALYGALSDSFNGLQGVDPEADLALALSELAAVVFGVLAHLPADEVTLAQFAYAVAGVADSELAQILVARFDAQGIL